MLALHNMHPPIIHRFFCVILLATNLRIETSRVPMYIIPLFFHKFSKVLLQSGSPPTAVLGDFGLSGGFSLNVVSADNPGKILASNNLTDSKCGLRLKSCEEKSTLSSVMCTLSAWWVFQISRYSSSQICWELVSRKDFFGEFRFLSEISDAVMEGRRPPIPTETPNIFRQLIEQCWCHGIQLNFKTS